MFTAQEKTQVLKFPDGIVALSSGIRSLAALCETSAHTAIRPALNDALYGASEVWRLAALWFADLSGTPENGIVESRDRATALQQAQGHYNAMLTAFDPLLAATASAPDFLTADARFKTAKATLSGFDWSLGYANPNHNDDAATPFDEPKTVVGPHGDWPRATASLKAVSQQLLIPWRDFLTVYMTVPVYNQTANHAFNEQMERFARMVDRLSRVWAMHVEVETMLDASAINGDVAATNGMRTRAFFRTLLQNELVFNNRTSVGKNWRGRYFARGIVEDLRGLYFQEFVVPLGRTEGNGKAWAYQLVLSGVHGRFHAMLADFWRSLDAWAQAAFGFYHPLPDPTKFKPITPDGSQMEPTDPPVQSSLIPLGEFDTEAGQIAAARAAASGVTAQLDQVLASLRGREGAEI